MLTLTPPLYQIRGVTIARDHEDRDMFYALPPLPRLAASAAGGGLVLYKYRRDLIDNPAVDPTQARGGGLALFEVEAPLPGGAALQAELASASGQTNARLAPVTFRSGTVHAVIAKTDGDQLIEDLVQTTSAPLTAPHHAAFELALTPEGATLVERAAQDGALPVGVAYELRFLALAPALHARVTMDYDRIYDHFGVSGQFTYYVQAGFDVDLKWLVEHDLIHIEIISFTDSADQQRQQQTVMELVGAQIQADFFRSSVPPDPQPGAGGAVAKLLAGLLGGDKGVSSASALFVLRAKAEVVKEHKTLELTYDGQAAVELTHVITGGLATLVTGAPPTTVQEIDLSDPFFSTLTVDVVSAIAFDELPDLVEAVVDLAHGDVRASYSFTATANGPYHFRTAIASRTADTYTYSLAYHFDPDRGGGDPIVHAGPFDAHERVLVVDPLANLVYRRVRCKLEALEPTLVSRIHLDVRTRDSAGSELARDELVLDAQTPEKVWCRHFPPGTDPRMHIRTSWEDPQGALHAGDDTEVPGDTFIAHGPFKGTLSLQVLAGVDFSSLTEAQVELRYQDGDYVVERTLTFLPATGTAQQSVEIPILDPGRDTYQWRLVTIARDGTSHATDWASTNVRLLVASATPARTGDVRIVWVGEPPNGVLGLRVDLHVEGDSDQSHSVFLPPGPSPQQTITVPLDPQGRLRYRFEVRREMATGEEPVSSGSGDSDLLVVRATA
jgi:hypothetical protein